MACLEMCIYFKTVDRNRRYLLTHKTPRSLENPFNKSSFLSDRIGIPSACPLTFLWTVKGAKYASARKKSRRARRSKTFPRGWRFSHALAYCSPYYLLGKWWTFGSLLEFWFYEKSENWNIRKKNLTEQDKKLCSHITCVRDTNRTVDRRLLSKPSRSIDSHFFWKNTLHCFITRRSHKNIKETIILFH